MQGNGKILNPIRLRPEPRVLVAENNSANIQKIRAALGVENYEIIPAINACQVLERTFSAKPDILLLDLAMSGLDGLEISRSLRAAAATKELPIIFLSAVGNLELVVDALSVGGADCIIKPFHPDELRWRVRVQLALRSTLEELRGLAAEQEELLGILAHDLKSLLGGISLSAKLAQDRLSQNGIKRAAAVAAIIGGSSARLLAFVKNFLATTASNSNNVGSSANMSSKERLSARILFAAEQTQSVEAINAALATAGHEIFPSGDGEAALSRLESTLPDLVLVDDSLPRFDGFQTLARVCASARSRNIPVIFISASGNRESVVRAFEAGAIDCLSRPFCLEELALRVETQLALKFARDRLLLLTTDQDRLLGVLVREFETRLATMRYNAASLWDQTRGIEDLRAAQMAENILQSSKQLFDFVGRFLEEAGGKRLSLRLAPMSLRRAVARTLERYSEPARAKQVRLLLDGPGHGEGVVIADEQGVNRVLDNLLSNAIKFSPPETTVRLSIHSTNRQVQCQIADQGPGFTDEDKASMYQRFGRLSARPTGGEGSTGLGLSIVRKLVRAMSGEISCQSKPGFGSLFTIGFPRPSAVEA